ncbi:RHS repeat domain-containing protein [Pseudoxanthomonas indica]|uniref:RHS repeat-associated core domain-containing protein n=1 Tax=Pseudoxanthomonas indica TaxID=428993 RepID=A0A1T5KCB8_9GAMM|nr:RHS repeat-associated core domain-containing protein [Pseudoxanthomonas indica]GGD48415.1 hypothetical protein GCM10007235_20420 [Pseudoxanthomonas indica]SKC61353.1 RHS repeat-associated core domain-containing protein [Pseudoxanthomonas indica]
MNHNLATGQRRRSYRAIGLSLALLLAGGAANVASAQTYSKTQTVEYQDDLGLWVLGQVKRTTTNNVETSRTLYEWKAMPTKVYGFDNQLRKSIDYDRTSAVSTGQLGTVKTVADGRNNTTTLTSWKRGTPQRIDFADGRYATAGVGNSGRIDWAEDENRSRTCYAYDGMGRLARITYTSESATNTCDTSAWAETTLNFAPSAIGRYGLPAGYWIQYVDTGKGRTVRHFDALWRPVLEEQFDNTDNPTALATRSMVVKRYDAAGQLEFQSYPVASLTTIGDASLKGVWTDHDALGRVTSSSQDSELGLLTTLTEYLTGFKVKVTNPKLQSSTTSFMTYDQPTMDWPVLVEHPESAFTHISRDVYGKPKKIRRSNNVSPTGGSLAVDRVYTYNTKQELCASTEPETGTTLMGYDAAGNLSWSAAGLAAGTACDATGTSSAVVARKAARSYDARNRLRTLNFPDGLGNQVWTYLPTGKPGVLTAYNAANNGEPVVTTYSYNRRGLLYHERLVTSLLDWPYEYKYNANGHLASNNWHGIVVAYAPNQLGQPTQAGSYASNVQYFPNGAVKQFTYGNGIVHTLTQNARQLPARSVDGALLDLSYAYDKHANVASITDATAGARQSRTMTYDNLDRLLTANGPSFGAATYGYDVLDNLSSVKVTGGMHPRDHSYHYDLGNRLDSVTQVPGSAMVTALSYDPQGNVYNKNGVVHKFDYGNRLREVVGKGSYLYDAHGRRVRDTINGVAAHSQYLMNGQLAFSTDSRTGKVREHIYLGDDPVAIRERDAPTNVYTYRYLHTDGLGSALVETDATQAVLERSEYEPYGALTNRAEKDDVGYTGHRQDAATGLTYMQQRYYDSEVGRFLSVDPVTAYASPGSNFNRYSYALGNPFKFLDADGRMPTQAQNDRVPVDTNGRGLAYAFLAWLLGQAAVDGVQQNQTSDDGKEGTRELGNLEPIHAPNHPENNPKIKELSDRDLGEAINNPADGESVKVRGNTVLDGNTRINEALDRGWPADTVIPVIEYEELPDPDSNPLGPYGDYD